MGAHQWLWGRNLMFLALERGVLEHLEHPPWMRACYTVIMRQYNFVTHALLILCHTAR